MLLVGGGYVHGNCGAVSDEDPEGDNVKWNLDLDTGILRISGTGAMADYSAKLGQKNNNELTTVTNDTRPWSGLVDLVTESVIGDGVTHAGNYAFSGMRNMKNYTLGRNVTSLGDNLFQLSGIAGTAFIPASIERMGIRVFSRCKYITDADLITVLLPYVSFAEEEIQENQYIFEVFTEEELADTFAKINAEDNSKIKYYTIKLGADITMTGGLNQSRHNVVLFGEGHVLNFSSGSFNLSENAELNLGSDTYDGTLTVKSEDDTHCIFNLTNSSEINIYDGVTVGPSNASGQAGGIQLDKNAKLNMFGGRIYDCHNFFSVAGAVYLHDASIFTMYDGIIENCSGLDGGAVGLGGGTPISSSGNPQYTKFYMKGGTIKNCKDEYYGGGAVCAITGNPTEFIMDGGTITGCKADGNGYGGAIFIYCTNPTSSILLNKGTITGNTANKYGGGIFVYQGSVKIADGFGLYGNTAAEAGDDIFNNKANVTIGTAPANKELGCGHKIDGWYKDESTRWTCSAPTEQYTKTGAPDAGGYALKAAHGIPSQYILSYGDGRSGDAGPDFTFDYDPDLPHELPYEIKHFTQNEINEIQNDNPLYGNISNEGIYFLAWTAYVPRSLSSGLDMNAPCYLKADDGTYTEVTKFDPDGTYYQVEICDKTPDRNLGLVTYHAQWMKINIDVDVNIQVDKNLTFSDAFANQRVMVEDYQKEILAKNIKPADIVGGNCRISLSMTVADVNNKDEQNAITEYLTKNYPDAETLDYDVTIEKKVEQEMYYSGSGIYAIVEEKSGVIHEVSDAVEIKFAVPVQWQNGTVKMLRAHTNPKNGEITVTECEDLDDISDDYLISSNEFSSYSMIYMPPKASEGTGGSSGTHYYTLHYESNGGTAYEDESYLFGKVVELGKIPSRDGYAFTGWYQDAELTIKISSIKMTGGKTVYAGWKETAVPEMLNGDEHFAYVIGYDDGTVKPNANITRAEIASIFFRLLREQVRDENLTYDNTFEDVNETMWYNTAVSTMASLGIIKGRDDDIFDPNANISRSEFATICARFDTGINSGSSNFNDISGHWAEEAIEKAVSLGWIRGYSDGTFRPDIFITRAEAMTLINRVLCRIPEKDSDLLYDMRVWLDNSPADWFYLAVQEATNSHIHNYNNQWVELTADPDWTMYQ